MKPFKNRLHAGKLLARQLDAYAHRADVVVLGLPRGGVPVASVVADALDAPLDIMLVRKLGVPGYEELAMGALAGNGQRVINDEVVQMLRISDQAIEAVAQRESLEIARREKLYRGERPPLPLRDHTVILIDDGLATGATMMAAVQAVRSENPGQVVIAVPVGAPDTCRKLRNEVDRMICLRTPDDFGAVGSWYEDFAQVQDEDVIDLLQHAQPRQRAGTDAAAIDQRGGKYS